MYIDMRNQARRAQALREFENKNYQKAMLVAAGIGLDAYKPIDLFQGKQFGEPEVAVAVIAHRPLEAHKELIESIFPLFEDDKYGLLLVSNAEKNIFASLDDRIKAKCKIVVSGGNFGASGGRNFAIAAFDGQEIVFVDDDGLTDETSIRSLVRSKRNNAAVCVRGRVVPKTDFTSAPPYHYDLGDYPRYRFPDIEGMTIWDMSALRKEQFDPLLYGHEGVELAYRLFTYFGYESFLYEPTAVLRHDFTKPESDHQSASSKQSRMNKMTDYLSVKHPRLYVFKSIYYNLEKACDSARLLKYRQDFNMSQINDTEKANVVVLTTNFNGEEFIPDYIESLTRQTDRDFRVVFVDDGSTDKSMDIFKSLTENDPRFEIVVNQGSGRASALNTAINEARSGEIAIIADVDDISVPQRVEWTKKAYELFPEDTAIGFGIFDKKSAIRGARPHVIKPTSLKIRSFTGMPAPFPGFSFLIGEKILPFDENLDAGIDCDWISRNMLAGNFEGRILPLSVSYYRLHDNQITTGKRQTQIDVSIGCVRNCHENALGRALDQIELRCLDMFMGWRKVQNTGNLLELNKYASVLVLNTSCFDHQESIDFGEYISAHVRVASQHLQKPSAGRESKSSAGAKQDTTVNRLKRMAHRHIPYRFHPFLRRQYHRWFV